MADDMVGTRFSRLLILSSTDINGARLGTAANHQVEVLCDCGNRYVTSARAIRRGRTTSCGCAHREKATTHGLSDRPLYAVWQSMKSRCYRKSANMFPSYGGRGIGICDEWRDNVIAFISWAEANGYAQGLQIDRIDTNGDYSPENCRFVPSKENNRNRRSNRLICYRGKEITLAQLAEDSGVPYDRLRQRIVKLGWSPEMAAA